MPYEKDAARKSIEGLVGRLFDALDSSHWSGSSQRQ